MFMHTRPAMTLQEAIDARASVRFFAPEPVTNDEINALLRAAVRAPTAMHGEPWVFVIVQDAARLKTLSDAVKAGVLAKAMATHLLHPDFDALHGAGTLIAIGARRTGPFVDADCWLAAENLMLAATAMGLGTCCVGSVVAVLNDAGVKADLGIPDDVRIVAPIVVGHAANAPQPTGRRDPDIVTWLA
jgi:nitroreductase